MQPFDKSLPEKPHESSHASQALNVDCLSSSTGPARVLSNTVGFNLSIRPEKHSQDTQKKQSIKSKLQDEKGIAKHNGKNKQEKCEKKQDTQTSNFRLKQCIKSNTQKSKNSYSQNISHKYSRQSLSSSDHIIQEISSTSKGLNQDKLNKLAKQSKSISKDFELKLGKNSSFLQKQKPCKKMDYLLNSSESSMFYEASSNSKSKSKSSKNDNKKSYFHKKFMNKSQNRNKIQRTTRKTPNYYNSNKFSKQKRSKPSSHTIKYVEKNKYFIQSKKDQQNTKNKKLFFQSWKSHLQVLSFAQSQLSYLCQHTKWKLNFKQQLAQIGVNTYKCKAEVVVIEQQIKRYEGICLSAKNKKQAKHEASVFCLAELYTHIGGLWEKMQWIREKKPTLCQPQRSNNTHVLNLWLNGKYFDQTKVWNLQQKLELPQNLQVEGYLKTLNSLKRQLYYFCSHYNRIFMQPVWITHQPNPIGYWQVEGSVKFEAEAKMYECKFKNKGKNIKVATEKVCHAILLQFYSEFPALYVNFRKVKEERGFH